MSTISSGVGLVSGLPIQELVDSLIQVQRNPINQLQDRLGVLTARRTALLQLSAQLLSLQNTATQFGKSDFFQSAAVSSSNESVILASAEPGAVPGEYTFNVRNLATTHQLISAGFADDDALVGAGTLTLEGAAGLLNRPTDLSALNGGQGVQVGKIKITDRAGNDATVDLITAKTIDDVTNAINTTTGINVQARVDGDRLIIEDQSGGTGNLTISEVGAGRTATDLGILQSVAANELFGDTIVSVSEETSLRQLNDRNGIRTRDGLDDFEVTLANGQTLTFNLSEVIRPDTPLTLLNNGNGVPGGTIRITDRAGRSAEVDLTGAATAQDVLDAINNASGVNVTASIIGTQFTIEDNSIADGETAANDLLIEDVDSTTAEALGLAGSTISSTLNGRDVYSVDSIGDILRVINLDPDNGGQLTASISTDGFGITLTDTTSGSNVLTVTALSDSQAAEDLGLLGPVTGNTVASRRLVAELNTVLLRSLNGGRGVDLSDLQITDRNGVSHSVDVSNAVTLSDVIDAINAAPTSITAAVSSSGLGIELIDTSNGSGNLVIAGTTAVDLKLDVNDTVDRVESGNLQKQYVSAATRLEDFNNGIPRGRFRITDSSGQSAVVDLSQGDEKTLQDVIDEINSRPTDIEARINDTGDGLILVDTAGGSGVLSVAEEGGAVAKALGILGEAAEGETQIDGSFETRIEISANDTLNDVLTKIRNSNADVNASIINDGSAGRPLRLSLTSTQSGREGELAVDTGKTGLSFDVLAEAQDATVVFGSVDADKPLVLTTSSNTLDGAVSGVRLDLIGAAEEPVTVSVTRDNDAIVEQFRDFVTNFNALISTLDDQTSFDPETEVRGILQADATARRIRQSLTGLTARTVSGLPTTLNRLGSVGITLGSGSRLELDENKLREALVNDPEGVEELFTLEETDDDGNVIRTGLGGIIEAEIDRLTDNETGAIPLREESIQTSEDQLNERIDQLELLLDRRRERLLDQFTAMEAVIARLQSQQSALSALSALAPASSGIQV